MADVGAGMSIMESVGEMRRRSEHVLSKWVWIEVAET
jgi:hypothetical protein